MIARALAAAAAAALTLVVPGTAAADGAGTADVRTLQEGWYTANPTCSGPTGCVVPPAEQSPFPPGTLHVAVAGGETTATSYLTFDLGTLPSGVTLTAGLLTVPLDTQDEDGSMQPEAAHVQACLVTSKVVDAEGSASAPPSASCVVSAPAVYRPTPAPALTIDVTPFVAAWSEGAAVALLPAAKAAEARETWRVVFSARRRTPAVTPPASVRLVFSTPGSPGSITGLPQPAPPPPVQPPLSAGNLSIPAGPVAPVPAPVPAPQAVPRTEPPPVVTPAVPVATLRRIGAPPQAWLLPLIALAGLIAAGRVLTRDLRRPVTVAV